MNCFLIKSCIYLFNCDAPFVVYTANNGILLGFSLFLYLFSTAFYVQLVHLILHHQSVRPPTGQANSFNDIQRRRSRTNLHKARMQIMFPKAYERCIFQCMLVPAVRGAHRANPCPAFKEPFGQFRDRSL